MSTMKLLSLFLTVPTFTAATELGNSDMTFQDYLTKHHKQYKSQEFHKRQKIYEATKIRVRDQNKAYLSGHSTWWAEINHLADSTDQELASVGAQRATQAHSSLSTTSSSAAPPAAPSAVRTNPNEKSWINYQTPIKSQGSCGGCWAESTTETLESHLAIAENSTTPLVLSPQTLVDCAKNPLQCGGTGGCEGATAEIGYNFTRDNGLPLSSAYPYNGKDGKCIHYSSKVTCSGYTKLQTNSAKALETTIANVGPVAVVVAASWDTYAGGILADGCLSWLGSCTLDHVVVVVGYAPDYWLVRNSWGENWGESGYIRLTRKNDNTTYKDTNPSQGAACKPFPKQQNVMGECGILFDASYPTGVIRSK